MRDSEIVDEVAVARAIQGDGAVWRSLRRNERREVYRYVVARRDLELAEARSWSSVRRMHAAGNAPVNDDEKLTYQDWLLRIAQAADVEPADLLTCAKRVLGRAAKAAA